MHTLAQGGTWYVVPTPFDEGQSLDVGGLERIIQSSRRWGVDGYLILGVTSEADTLTEQERGLVLRTVMAAADTTPVVVGCTEQHDIPTIRRAQEALDAGAAGVMVAAPRWAHSEALIQAHYEKVGRDCGPQLLIQDEPAATGVTISADRLARIVEATGAAAVKLEAPPTAPKIEELSKATHGHVTIFGGLGGVSALSELLSGSSGTMTGFSFPEILKRLLTAFRDGDVEDAQRTYDYYLPLLMFEAQPQFGLLIRKRLLQWRQVIDNPSVRRGAGHLPSGMERDLQSLLTRLRIDPVSGLAESTS